MPFPGRPDRHPGGRDDIYLLAADADRLGDVVIVGTGVRDVFRVHGCKQAGKDDRDEQRPERKRHAIAQEGPHTYSSPLQVAGL